MDQVDPTSEGKKLRVLLKLNHVSDDKPSTPSSSLFTTTKLCQTTEKEKTPLGNTNKIVVLYFLV